mmetsp:Transcript_25646/g.77900  ORF Transcript_25646/g.77900 Transcript_25646/m.77900 type:complete len:211 (+) Transcript_25646:1974-2606(+)
MSVSDEVQRRLLASKSHRLTISVRISWISMSAHGSLSSVPILMAGLSKLCHRSLGWRRGLSGAGRRWPRVSSLARISAPDSTSAACEEEEGEEGAEEEREKPLFSLSLPLSASLPLSEEERERPSRSERAEEGWKSEEGAGPRRKGGEDGALEASEREEHKGAIARGRGEGGEGGAGRERKREEGEEPGGERVCGARSRTEQKRERRTVA